MKLSKDKISSNMDLEYSESGEISRIFLARPTQTSEPNYLWLKEQTNFINGFNLELDLNISHKFEGFALVFQQMSDTAIGDNSGGLGYSGIENSIALEFDSQYSEDKSDPITTNNRHLSFIPAKINLAHESNSIAWNNNPINYNNNHQ